LKRAELLAAQKGDDRVAFARAQAAALEPRLALVFNVARRRGA
jgi:hypothetical protein